MFELIYSYVIYPHVLEWGAIYQDSWTAPKKSLRTKIQITAGIQQSDRDNGAFQSGPALQSKAK